MGNELNERAKEIEALVKQAQKGDQDSFAKLYDIFIDPIYRYVFYRVKNEDSEDLVETVFLKVWEHLRKYKKDKKSSFSSWIFRIAHNQVVDYYRSNKDKMMEELNFQVADNKREHNPIRVAEDNIDQKILKKALSRIKKQYQDVIVYKFVNDFSNKEISEILKKSEGSVRILQFRALKALERELRDMGVFPHL